ncbi:MAG: SDR family NAD(P)-dependent oxidoreductase [Candidatus Cloacimonetes bacterium]|nr:SDR family NAD(P)-dependent oxidoreductase [Candidatus Cloacimonadota bacterium]
MNSKIHHSFRRNKIKIQDAKVLITGASSGIGKAIALEFANKGAILAITSRPINLLRKVVEEIRNTFSSIPSPLPKPLTFISLKTNVR